MVDVSCPKCAARLKAPDDRIGKKAKCTKCGEVFRVPDPVPMAEPVGEPQKPSSRALPDDDEDDRTELMTADQMPPLPPPKPKPTPAPPPNAVAALPSADAFDFTQPAAPAAKPAPTPAPPPAPAKPAAAKAAPAAKPAKPLQEETPPKADKPKSKPKPAPEPAPASPFAFNFGDPNPEEAETPRRKQRREAADLDEEFEEKPHDKKRRDEDDDKLDEKPRKQTRDEEKDDEPRKKKPAADEPEAEAADDKPRYRRPEKKAGMGQAILYTALAGALALVLGIAAIIVFVKQNKPAEPTKKDEKKEEPAPEPPPVVTPAPKDDKAKVDPKKPKEPEPKPKEPEPKPKEPEPKKVEPKPKEVLPPGPKLRATFGFPAAVKGFSFAPLAAKPEPPDRALPATADLDARFEDIKVVYPPRRKNDDVIAVVRGAAADKWAIDVYSGTSGRKAEHIEVTGAAQFTDVSADRKQFLAVVGTAATVWDLEKKTKLLDAADLYADKPEHKAAGLAAAVFLGQTDGREYGPTGKLLLVSTAGAVSVYDIATKAIAGEYVPPDGRAGQLVLGRSLAVNGQGIGVVMDLDGVLHDIDAAPRVALARKIDIGGRVVKSLGLAAERGKGRVLYAFELDKGGKTERGVLFLPAGATDTKQVKLLRWPDAAGEPTGAFLAHTETGGVTVANGVVFFETNRESGAFTPLGLARADKGLLATGDEDNFWYAIPDPAKPGAAFFRGVALPLDDFAALSAAFRRGQPLATLRLDKTGLAK